MKLLPEEAFALRKLLSGETAFEKAALQQLYFAEVTERSETGVGFFSTIRFLGSLPHPDKKQWDWIFCHEELIHGGSFTAWFDSPNIIELEAITFDDAWPKRFDKGLFYERPAEQDSGSTRSPH